MKDTPRAIEDLLLTLLAERTEVERLAMTCEMFDTAKTLIAAEVRARRGDIAPLELRAEIFERLYRDDFDTATLARMRAAILAIPR